MSRLVDLTGRVFGRLTVLGYSHTTITPSGQKKPHWLCRCECGQEKAIKGCSLTNGTTRSCGCLKSEETRTRMTKHGHTSWKGPPSRTYNTWRGMIARCSSPDNVAYKNYGGRGITVCQEWLNFEAFLTDMGERPGECTLDRIDTNGNYCKENCRWVSPIQQGRNSRKNRLVTIGGATHCISEWCELLEISLGTVSYRLSSGWSAFEALVVPPNQITSQVRSLRQDSPSQSPSEAP